MAGIFDGLGATTINNYKKGAADEVVENNPFLSYLFKNGKIERQQGGSALEGVIEAGLFTPTISSDGDDNSALFTNHVHDKRWVQQWAQSKVATSINFGEIRRNFGAQALVNTADVKIPRMFKAIMTNGDTSLNGLILNCNSAAYTGTGLPLDGLPTLLPGASTQHTVGQAVTAYDLEGFNPTTGAVTGAVPAVTDLEVSVGGNSVLTPNYCGLSIKYGAITGVDGVKGDAWKGTMVNSEATTFGGNILKYSQYTATRAARFAGMDTSYRPTFGVLNMTDYIAMGNAVQALQTVHLVPGGDAVDKNGTGFKTSGMIYHAGLWWYQDQTMKDGRGYVINANQANFRLQPILDTVEREAIPTGMNTSGKVEHSDMIESHIHFDINRLALNCLAIVSGQMQFYPRYQACWDAYVP